ncbi:8-oxo-dGTP diphosphatase [Candidatus Uhrbacteria bacterium]|nr:8-oxo-dGTP diphosphatase [Candidatus Uhrbacteria bacterium]
MTSTCTLVYLIRDGRVCLGFKKRGFGAGWWNGFGGKVRSGEDVRTAAVRELWEECRVRVAPEALVDAGALRFTFLAEAEKTIQVRIFRVERFDSEPIETEEMRPQWFTPDTLPYDEMWSDDRVWMPRFLNGERVRGWFQFDANNRHVAYELEGTEEVIHWPRTTPLRR